MIIIIVIFDKSFLTSFRNKIKKERAFFLFTFATGRVVGPDQGQYLQRGVGHLVLL